MTKARDLAGFASSSVTTTASDGLVLKGDGSSTDVVIKNGANATVATVADGTTNLAVVGAVTGALAQGAIQVGNSSGVAAPLTIGSSAQLLQSNGTTAAWATVSSDPAAVVFPSNWASPTNTYTSSGTWSKGSLDDDDYVWFFLLSSGEGGAEITPGDGGAVRLIYAKAGVLNGAAYVIGAAVTGTSNNQEPIAQNHSTLTLASGQGGRVFTTNTRISSDSDFQNPNLVISSPISGVGGTYLNGSPAESYKFSTEPLPSGYQLFFRGAWSNTQGNNTIFGGASGQRTNYSYVNTSLLSGNGGTTSSKDGIAPGGGGGTSGSGVGGTGAAGNVRVYHV